MNDEMGQTDSVQVSLEKSEEVELENTDESREKEDEECQS
jgi:hypothetical protein